MAPRLGRALRHRNYRLFFIGQGTSVIGTWLTRFATVWMAYRLTHSAWVLGVLGFCSQAPTCLLAPIGGVWVDRLDRHRVIVVTQIAAMLQSAALAFFTFTGLMTVWHLAVLGAIQGVINAFDMPARQSFLRQMIEDRADLPNAIALNSSMVNGARLIGPVVAAELVAWFGEGWCFTIDAASYLAVIASLLMMRVAKRELPPRGGGVWDEMVDGWRYVAKAPLVRAVLLLLVGSSVLGGSYSTLLPLIAGGPLGGGPHTLGLLMGAAGLGALCGALYLAQRQSVVGLGTVISRCAMGLGVGMVAINFATTTWIAVPIMFVVGTSLMVQMASTNTIIQTIVDHDKLGRVMSLYAVAFFGGAPLGALLEGSLASSIGAMRTFLVAGLAMMACALAFARALPGLRELSRPLYVKLHLIDE
ncbi:MAG TPA: MFS transporter [Kofleriaceae bacterium]|nr:MFS transporter [Kofleriaceae bacterium]